MAYAWKRSPPTSPVTVTPLLLELLSINAYEVYRDGRYVALTR